MFHLVKYCNRQPKPKSSSYTTAIILSSGTRLSEEQSIPNDSTEPKNSFSIWSTVDTKVAQKKPVGTNTSRAIIEVQRYLEDSLQQRNANPYLSQLARKTLYCHGTSVPCEGVFSKSGLLISDRRTRLSSNKVEMLMFLNQST